MRWPSALSFVLAAIGLIGACGPQRPASAPHAAADASVAVGSHLTPAPTPAEAMVRPYEALVAGDEAAYRRAVLFRPPSAYAEAKAHLQLASAQLYRAVRAHHITGERVRDAGFDRNESLIIREPLSPADIKSMRDALTKMPWQIDGNVARPTTGPGAADDRPDAPRVERLRDGWILVATDAGADAEPEHLRLLAESANIDAGIVTAAAEQVDAGKLQTILAINQFIDTQHTAVAERALAKVMAAPPTGPVVVVTDVETGQPVAGATVEARCVLPPGKIEILESTTDARGRTRVQMEPESIHYIHVRADGYARGNADLDYVEPQGDRPAEVRLKIGRPIVVEVMLVLPDERRAAISVYEGNDYDPPAPGIRETVQPKRIKLPIEWQDAPPKLPEHNPMLRLNLISDSPHRDVKGVMHRVTHAQTRAGRELPVFRDAPPPDGKTFGLYLIGQSGFGDAVFVIGTLADARAAEAAEAKFQWTRNHRVLGATTTPASQSSATTSKTE